ncbi:MAG: hypothetical protein SGI74_03855 [Oligoflexia bacterium]|nr:hypothetical protein [Oligoflexia bacterium]
MKRRIIICAFLIAGCAQNQIVTEENTEIRPVKRFRSTSRTPSSENAKKIKPVESTLAQKVNQTFKSILTNDDKKAKLAYGRNYRHMPDFIQFAVDLRFKNYDHAIILLEKLEITPPEKEFWLKILNTKPARLVSPICEALKADTSLNFTESQEQVRWNNETDKLIESLISAQAKNAEPSELDKIIEQINCKHVGEALSCEPIEPALREKLLNDVFFDKIHNLQVRDTNFIKWNNKNYIKITEYQRHVTIDSLHKFFHAIQATPYDRQVKFLKRYRGIGRDLRSENIVGRIFGDLVLGDEKDMVLAEHIQSFLQAYPILNLTLGLEFELATCGLPTEIPAFKPPKPNANTSSSAGKNPSATATVSPSPVPKQ